MHEELSTARRLVFEAGAILLAHYAEPAAVSWKGKDDPVTTADRSASRFLVTELRRRFPGDGVLSEEEPDEVARLAHRRVWIIDPMDGTREFINRTDEFSVMLGLAVDGDPRLGLVYQPTAGKLYYGVAGGGAFLDQDGETRPLRVPAESDPRRMTIAISRSYLSKSVETIRERLGIPEVVRSGSLGLKIGLICEGRAHVYVTTSHRTYLWDLCAPEAILREAGGRMTNLHGVPFRYDRAATRNPDGVIASNGPAHDRLVAVTRRDHR